jgi:molecular chaperone DnaJ
MNTPEAYEELGLSPEASDAQLKAAWRKLVAVWHPDRNDSPDAPVRMQRINKAYQHIRLMRDGGESEDESPPHRKTHTRNVRLTLEEALHGCTRTLKGHYTLQCEACHGKGERVLAKNCGTCFGSGAVRRAALFGWLWNQEECPDCGGDGRQREICEPCNGQGETKHPYRNKVRFPAGISAGHVLAVPSARHGETEHELELHVELEPHPLFKLDEQGTLRCEMPVNGYAWMTQRWIEVPTPDGVQQMRLNRDATTYRLRGLGFPAEVRGDRGDYFVTVQPVFPEQESAETEALVKKLIAKTDVVPVEWAERLQQWQDQA